MEVSEKWGGTQKGIRWVAPKGWRVEPHTKEECPACGKEKVNREGWSAERSNDGHLSGPPNPVQPAGGVTGDIFWQVLMDVLPEVLCVGVWAVTEEKGGRRFRQIRLVSITPFWIPGV